MKPEIKSCTGSVGVERFRMLALSASAVDLNIPGFANEQQSRNSINGLITYLKYGHDFDHADPVVVSLVLFCFIDIRRRLISYAMLRSCEMQRARR